LAGVVLDGLVAGWPEASKPTLGDSEIAELRQVMKSLPLPLRDRMLALADRWGRHDLFEADAKQIAQGLRTSLADSTLDAPSRVDFARRLLGIEDNAASVSAILKQVTPQVAPELQTGLLDALGESRQLSAGQAIIDKWKTFTPTAQRTALSVVLRKPNWIGTLLDGITTGKVDAKDLQPQHWQLLNNYKDPAIAQRAAELQKSAGRAVNPDKKKLLDALLPVADKSGDPIKGKEVFVKNCQVCHTIEGEGGKVGPDLTGIGARPKGDLLIEIIDPNRSVEGTYRMWIAETRDDAITGRLLAETQTSIEILDATGQTHVLERSKVKKLRASELSVMPEGFEQIAPEDIGNLLEFIGSSKVKH
jgi:putative heme-binding domain-containing protein